jgi:hypothetical protein
MVSPPRPQMSTVVKTVDGLTLAGFDIAAVRRR